MPRHSAGEIVLVNFPYEDGTGSKPRPCLILRYNSHSHRYQIVPITKRIRTGREYFTIDNSMVTIPLRFNPSQIKLAQLLWIPESAVIHGLTAMNLSDFQAVYKRVFF